jgi:hypothetical protein
MTQKIVVAASVKQAVEAAEAFGWTVMYPGEGLSEMIGKFNSGEVEVIVIAERSMATGYNLRPKGEVTFLYLHGTEPPGSAMRFQIEARVRR